MIILQDCLQRSDFNMNYFHKESFGQLQQSDQGSQSTSLFTVSVPDYATSIEINGSMNFLDALDDMNVPINQDCRSAICGACKCQVTKGEIEGNSENGLTEDELSQGHVLAWSTRIPRAC